MYTWRKSSYSGENGSCVEVAIAGPLVGVRDSKNASAGHLTVASGGWSAFVGIVKGDPQATEPTSTGPAGR